MTESPPVVDLSAIRAPAENPAATKADWETLLGKRVRVYDGPRQSIRAEGEIIGVIAAPTLVILQDDGTRAYESSDLPTEYAYVEWRQLR